LCNGVVVDARVGLGLLMLCFALLLVQVTCDCCVACVACNV